MKTAYVFLVDGFEDIEAITPIDCLRRAGAKVTVVGVSGKAAVSARGLTVSCDSLLSDARTGPLPDLAVLPGGGPGSKNLGASTALRDFIGRMMAEKRLVGAICGAPALALGAWGMLDGRTWTCFPGMEKGLPGKHLSDRVVVDGNLVTSRAPGTAEEFALALVSILCGKPAANKLAEEILARG